ncbi:nucleolar complex-associated protein 3 [Lindgomyces ingoldianus]|uniref:Nucleolar complex-associated protein 3 n=1 Tax=Lindgomyces ingoldianus TaxID=673940 RepID=A0ACB6REB5_9PLEO|nr:nucleolar complex-associated protein 3 [Lindgomyces ingoldianus]KAF2477541.1 nucleolar complex-associated protein 3 [Lindgomyces ingoldianus]
MSRIPAPKRRRLSPPKADGCTSPPPKNYKSSFVSSAAKWNLEQDYEQRPRKLKAKQKDNGKLPIRTTEGWVEQEPTKDDIAKDEDASDSFLGSGSEGEGKHESEEVKEEKPKISQRQQIVEAKEELARIASLVNEDPEEHIGALRTLAHLAASENNTVRKLALATQVAIFKDLIPGYRIRPLPEDNMTDKVSKEVRKLRAFEQKLVSSYQAYVQELAKLTKISSSALSEESTSLATVAMSCACNLLVTVPHFNFRGELLKIVIGKLSTKRVDGDFVKCRESLETLFQNDEDGNASLDAVTMLTKMMKGKHYNFDESVLNTFLHLRLLSEFTLKASYHSIDKPAVQQYQGKKIKEKREFRSKKQRKLLKERKVIEKEMKEADAVVSHEERDRIQAETLKMVFVAYFRILKARKNKLMGAVLEGLARYAHLINQDFFGDILEALRDLITQAELSATIDLDEEEDEDEDEESSQRNATRESLLCVITAFALLEGQDGAKAASTLKLDLSFFITHLYRTLHPVSLNPDIEFSAKSLHLPDPHAPDARTQNTATNKINVQTTIVLLIRSLSSVLLPPAALRAVPPIRIAAFCKQLMMISLQLPEKSCIAMLGLITKVTKTHGRKIGALWNTEERRGDGVFDALKTDIEGSNPFAGTVWEGEILRLHFSPTVRDAVIGIEKNALEAR